MEKYVNETRRVCPGPFKAEAGPCGRQDVGWMHTSSRSAPVLRQVCLIPALPPWGPRETRSGGVGDPRFWAVSGRACSPSDLFPSYQNPLQQHSLLPSPSPSLGWCPPTPSPSGCGSLVPAQSPRAGRGELPSAHVSGRRLTSGHGTGPWL